MSTAPLGPAGAVKIRYDYRQVTAPNRARPDIQAAFMRRIEGEAGKTRDLMSGFLGGD